MTLTAREADRLLIVAPNWLGDLVMATVLLEALTGDAVSDPPRLTLAVRRRWLPLVLDDPRLETILPYERTGAHRGWRGQLRLAGQWRERHPGSALLLAPSFRVALTAWLARIPSRLGYREDGRGPLLTDSLARPARGSVHYTEEMLALGRLWAEATGRAWRDPPLHRPVLRGRLATTVALSPCKGPPLWVLAVSGTYGEAKSWPASRAAVFMDRAVAERSVRVVLMGDGAGRRTLETLRVQGRTPWRRELPGGPGIVDLVGRTDLASLVRHLGNAELCVAVDSGLMHLAAALGVPTVGLYGSTSPIWTGPRGPRCTVVAARGFPCQPCFRRTCNQAAFCMETLTVEMVLAAADRLLAAMAEEEP